ncbi:MAG: RsmE family RNA methyltransferase, partial [Pacificimonas sp.]
MAYMKDGPASRASTRHVPRMFVHSRLADDVAVALSPEKARHLTLVLRSAEGDPVHLFDDVTGEWRARIETLTKRQAILRVERQLAPREPVPDIWLLAAPIKKARYGWIAEKAAELGAARLVPVLTERTGGVEAAQAKPERLFAHMIEAAEQCGRTALPTLGDAVKLETLLADWGRTEDTGARTLLFCDEEGGPDALQTMRAVPAPAAILIGPEGGFSRDERQAIADVPLGQRLSLGAR